MNGIFPINRLSTPRLVGILSSLTCLFVANTVLPSQDDYPHADEARMLSGYESAMAAGDQTAALEFVLDYSEVAYGKQAQKTIKLMHRYGYSLYKDGRYREAINVLKETLERSISVYGESGGEAFEINLNLGRAYSKWRTRWAPRLKYFDRALEILRERGEQESVIYVATLVSIVINLLDSDGLKGSYTADFREIQDYELVNQYQVPDQSEYRNNFDKPERYLMEAAEIGARLEYLDEYISAKIEVLHAKLKVMKTAELAAVSGGVDGFISKSTERKYYDLEEERLAAAIDKLAQDTDTNKGFLDAANNILLQIAWLQEDEERMIALCANGTMNSTDNYPPDRLYQISEGGVVFAPDIGIRVSTNIFKQTRTSRRQPRDKNGSPVKKPYFKPVCIDGQLMAALIHAPLVTMEEIR